VSEAAEKVGETIGTMAGDSTKQAGAAVQAKLDQGKAMMIQDAQASAAALARQASEAGKQAVAQAGELVQGAARQAGNQATQAATNLYQQGSRAGDFITQYAAEQPVTALPLKASSDRCSNQWRRAGWSLSSSS
jgi:hypothetical protein